MVIFSLVCAAHPSQLISILGLLGFALTLDVDRSRLFLLPSPLYALRAPVDRASKGISTYLRISISTACPSDLWEALLHVPVSCVWPLVTKPPKSPAKSTASSTSAY